MRERSLYAEILKVCGLMDLREHEGRTKRRKRREGRERKRERKRNVHGEEWRQEGGTEQGKKEKGLSSSESFKNTMSAVGTGEVVCKI